MYKNTIKHKTKLHSFRMQDDLAQALESKAKSEKTNKTKLLHVALRALLGIPQPSPVGAA